MLAYLVMASPMDVQVAPIVLIVCIQEWSPHEDDHPTWAPSIQHPQALQSLFIHEASNAVVCDDVVL